MKEESIINKTINLQRSNILMKQYKENNEVENSKVRQNKLIYGLSGSGKTFLIKEMIKDYKKRGYMLYIFGEGNEFRDTADLFNSHYIDMTDAGKSRNRNSANIITSYRLESIFKRILADVKENVKYKKNGEEFIDNINTLYNLAEHDYRVKTFEEPGIKLGIALINEVMTKLPIFFNYIDGRLIQLLTILIIKTMYVNRVEKFAVVIDEAFLKIVGRERYYEKVLDIIKKHGGEIVVSLQPYQGIKEMERLEELFDQKISTEEIKRN